MIAQHCHFISRIVQHSWNTCWEDPPFPSDFADFQSGFKPLSFQPIKKCWSAWTFLYLFFFKLILYAWKFLQNIWTPCSQQFRTTSSFSNSKKILYWIWMQKLSQKGLPCKVHHCFSIWKGSGSPAASPKTADFYRGLVWVHILNKPLQCCLLQGGQGQ